jgi:hypothetical protein
MYASLADVHLYLNIPTATTGDDALLNVLIAAAQQRIDDDVKRRFEATADEIRYYDAVDDTDGRTLKLCADLCNVTLVTAGGLTIPATEYVTDPRNTSPWGALRLKSTSVYAWNFFTAPEDAIEVTGRWACMLRKSITSIARATSVVTATLPETSGLTIGSKVYAASVTDTSFNGGFVLTAVTDTTIAWAQSGTNASSTGGAILYTPPTIRQACTRLTAWLYRQKDTQSGDADRPILAGDGSVIMPQTLPNDVQSLLWEWVKHL